MSERVAAGSVVIEALDADRAERDLRALVGLLKDAVDSGASVGYLPPLAEAEAEAYWRGVVDDVRRGSCVLLGAREAGGALVGTAQLLLAMRPNGSHRAEVAKVIVHTGARRRGIGRALMRAIEAHARQLGRTTLVLDTRQGDPSEPLYASVGYTLAGVIPRYAQSAGGALDPSAFYYRLLTEVAVGAAGRRGAGAPPAEVPE
jgi:ribosomal protein S18 acetylase RimI-like enzyme